jgi:RNA polymerase sigma factor (sigma-70 family)
MDSEWLAAQFETSRTRLRAVAYRMLGSTADAEDAVQEAWLRLSRSDTSGVVNLSGWLTTVVARVCLDVLRSRKSRREEPLDAAAAEPVASHEAGADPEHEAVLADSIGLALLVVLETLAPAERVAFVLHDMFDLPFEEIAPIVGRSSTATRQLASRARRRVHGTGTAAEDTATPQRHIVDAFLSASRSGDFDALLALLDPEVIVRADQAAVAMGASSEVRGPAAVAGTFSGRAQAAQMALVNGDPGLVWATGGQPRVAFVFTVAEGKVTEIEMVADSKRLEEMELTIV